MKTRFAEKIYVGILSLTHPDGSIIPLKLVWRTAGSGILTRFRMCARASPGKRGARACVSFAGSHGMSGNCGIPTGNGLWKGRIYENNGWSCIPAFIGWMDANISIPPERLQFISFLVKITCKSMYFPAAPQAAAFCCGISWVFISLSALCCIAQDD